MVMIVYWFVYIFIVLALLQHPLCDASDAAVLLPMVLSSDKHMQSVVVSSPKSTNCSLTDDSNGTVCQCAQSLVQHCVDLQHGGASCLQCAKSANITMFDGSKCPSSIASAYCDGGCQLNYTWLGSLPPARNDILSIKEQNLFCLNGSDITLAVDSILLESLRILGCNSNLLAGYYTGRGYYGDHLLGWSNESYMLLHGDTVAGLILCCESYQTNPSYCGNGGVNIFWRILKKQTGCKRNLIENELAPLGLALPEIDQHNPVGGLYALDLRKFSSIMYPLIPFGFRQLYATTIDFLTGLTIATAENSTHCSTHQTWYLPGADTLYATTYHIQGDFYFPKNIPSPFESEGTCGLSLSSEQLRLRACSQIATFMYDKAFVSGLSIVGCMVDCTASRLTGVDGAFVSVTFDVQEIDTKKQGLDKQHDGLDAAIVTWNTSGFNVTDEFQSTVGIGFRFIYFVQSIEDLSTTTNWSNFEGSNTSLSYANLAPNLTAAMLAYKAPPHPAPPNPNHVDSTVIIAATVPCVALVVTGVVIRLMILRSRQIRGEDDVKLTTISNVNSHYEDAVVMVPHNDNNNNNTTNNTNNNDNDDDDDAMHSNA